MSLGLLVSTVLLIRYDLKVNKSGLMAKACPLILALDSSFLDPPYQCLAKKSFQITLIFPMSIQAR